MKLMVAAAWLLASLSAAAADEVFKDKVKAGFSVLWSGYAAITTCKPTDRYELGAYVFVCDRYTYEYPDHYGTVNLVGRATVYQGQRLVSTFICLDEGKCIEGTTFKK